MIIDKSKTPVVEQPRGSKNGKSAKNIFRRLDFVESNSSFHGGPQKRAGLKLALWTWLSALVDTLVLISMSCFFMVAFSFLMQTPAKQVIVTLVKQPQLSHLFVGLFFISFWIYLITMRLMMGASVGEWTCGLRLGQPAQRLKLSYLFKVMARTTLILMTGVVVLPLLSLLFRRDLVGDLIGLKIYSLK